MLACALLMLSALPSVAFADVIMPNTHAIEKCVKITGLDAYQDHAFIGMVSPIMLPGQLEIVRLSNNECITVGNHYKFDSFLVYYAKKSYFDTIGISGIKTGNASSNGRQGIVDENFTLVGGEQVFAPYASYYVDNGDTAKSVTIEYKLECRSGAEICTPPNKCAVRVLLDCKLTKVKEEKSNQSIAPPNDLPPAPPNPEPDTNHSPTPQNPAPTPFETSHPLEAFWCWLIGIFGGKC